MRTSYTYEIETRDRNGLWMVEVVRDDSFSRDPRSIARSLLEQWINDHQGRLPGGRVFVFDDMAAEEIDDVAASVRVHVYRGVVHARDAVPVSAAYLGHPVLEFRGGRRRRWNLFPRVRKPSTSVRQARSDRSAAFREVSAV